MDIFFTNHDGSDRKAMKIPKEVWQIVEQRILKDATYVDHLAQLLKLPKGYKLESFASTHVSTADSVLLPSNSRRISKFSKVSINKKSIVIQPAYKKIVHTPVQEIISIMKQPKSSHSGAAGGQTIPQVPVKITSIVDLTRVAKVDLTREADVVDSPDNGCTDVLTSYGGNIEDSSNDVFVDYQNPNVDFTRDTDDVVDSPDNCCTDDLTSHGGKIEDFNNDNVFVDYQDPNVDYPNAGITWGQDATLFLLEKIKDYRLEHAAKGFKHVNLHQFLLNALKDQHIFEEITISQVQNKVRKLETKYKNFCEESARTGNERPVLANEDMMVEAFGRADDKIPPFTVTASGPVKRSRDEEAEDEIINNKRKKCHLKSKPTSSALFQQYMEKREAETARKEELYKQRTDALLQIADLFRKK